MYDEGVLGYTVEYQIVCYITFLCFSLGRTNLRKHHAVKMDRGNSPPFSWCVNSFRGYGESASKVRMIMKIYSDFFYEQRR